MPDDQGDVDVRRTTDPTLLRSVIEERSGYPAHVPESEGEGDRGLLRIGFRDRDEDLKEISWEQFSEELADKDLAGVYVDDGSDVEGEDRPVVLRKRDELEGDVDVEADDGDEGPGNDDGSDADGDGAEGGGAD